MAQQLGIVFLFVCGLAFIVAEMFVPGVVLGILGVSGVVASIYLAFQQNNALGWTLTGIGLASIPVLVILWTKVLSRVMAIHSTQEGFTSAQVGLKELVGQEGVALTQLRPSGTARFGDRKVDVVAESEVIDRDARVKVIEVKSNRVVVRVVRG